MHRVYNSYFSGRNAYYLERIVDAGLVGLHTASGSPYIVPPGATRPALHGIGALLSGLAAGVIVDHFGYNSAFLALAAAAAAALTVFALGMPETADPATVSLPS